MTVKESEILSWLSENTSTDKKNIIKGVQAQDDAAVIRQNNGFDLCATTDFVRGTGFYLFREGHLSLKDLGHYVVGANVSDIAAMGATPIGYLSVVRYKPDRTREEIKELLDGISEACLEFDCPLIGGDTGTYESDVLSGTALGSVKENQSLVRDTAKADYSVFVTGDLGRPAAAMAAASNGVTHKVASDFSEALEKWRRPKPRISIGTALSNLNAGIAAMDISDGLTASLIQMGKRSNVGFRIFEEQIPITQNVKNICNAIGREYLEVSCGASVDFELLFCAPLSYQEDIFKISKMTGVPITKIGTVTNELEIKMIKSNGSERETFPGVPWDHQVIDGGSIFRN